MLSAGAGQRVVWVQEPSSLRAQRILFPVLVRVPGVLDTAPCPLALPPQCVALAPLITDLSFQVPRSYFELLSPPLFCELGVFPLNGFRETSCFLNSLDLMEKMSSCLPPHLPHL